MYLSLTKQKLLDPQNFLKSGPEPAKLETTVAELWKLSVSEATELLRQDPWRMTWSTLALLRQAKQYPFIQSEQPRPQGLQTSPEVHSCWVQC